MGVANYCSGIWATKKPSTNIMFVKGKIIASFELVLPVF
jgi:hypothetical protein